MLLRFGWAVTLQSDQTKETRPWGTAETWQVILVALRLPRQGVERLQSPISVCQAVACVCALLVLHRIQTPPVSTKKEYECMQDAVVCKARQRLRKPKNTGVTPLQANTRQNRKKMFDVASTDG